MRYVPKPYGGVVGPVRLITLIGLLCVVGMLFYRARDASTWRFLGRDDTKDETADKIVDTAEPPPPATGATDADSEEREAAEEEFQAINDNSLELGREEMPAYWRLLAWVNRQPLALLRSRTKETSPPRFNDLLLHPGENRGQLVRLKLNVRRVIEYTAPENPEKFKKIYEIWGYTEQSQSWLYEVIATELPPGMPVGDNVAETIWVYGYLLKVQGYKSGGAEEKLRKAPLLAGRVAWQPAVSTAAKPDLPPIVWVGVAAAVAVICAGSVVGYMFVSKAKPQRKFDSRRAPADPQDVSSWLSQASRDEAESAVVYLKPNGHEREPEPPAGGN